MGFRACKVPNCKNRFKNGENPDGPNHVTLFPFPKDPSKLRKWLKAINLINLKPLDNHKVCHRHFPKSHLKLTNAHGKPTKKPHLLDWAVPILYVGEKVCAEIDLEPEVKQVFQEHCYANMKYDGSICHLETDTKRNEDNKNDLVSSIQDHQMWDDESIVLNLGNEVEITSEPPTVLALGEINLLLGKEIDRLNSDIALLVKEVTRLRRSLKGVSKILNDDQVKRLEDVEEGKPERKNPFSEKSLLESSQIFHSCGPKAYEYLRDIGYPIPSVRTINHFMKRLRKNPEKHEEFMKTWKERTAMAQERLNIEKAKRQARRSENADNWKQYYDVLKQSNSNEGWRRRIKRKKKTSPNKEDWETENLIAFLEHAESEDEKKNCDKDGKSVKRKKIVKEKGIGKGKGKGIGKGKEIDKRKKLEIKEESVKGKKIGKGKGTGKRKKLEIKEESAKRKKINKGKGAGKRMKLDLKEESENDPEAESDFNIDIEFDQSEMVNDNISEEALKDAIESIQTPDIEEDMDFKDFQEHPKCVLLPALPKNPVPQHLLEQECSTLPKEIYNAELK